VGERDVYQVLVWAWCAIAGITFVWLFRLTAPYGRHARAFGPMIHRTVGWVLMEAPSPLLMMVLFLAAPRRPGVAAWVLLGLWELHYVNRAFVFPLRMRGGQKQMPLAIVASAIAFNGVNAYLNGRWLTAFGPPYGDEWLRDPRLWLGGALFVVGFAINLHADAVLRGLRRGDERGYQIPRGGLYGVISCPNYFGEIVEWTGWAIATWSLAGASFALWTAANLIPRARSHHKWYREQFAEYPTERRAVLPFLY
jgi:3-oxo-5-alpha-steroid 4-dehydrogenase 1